MLPDLDLDRIPPRGTVPGIKGHDRRPQITVRVTPCLFGQASHYAEQRNQTVPELTRRALQALVDGYPDSLPEHVHNWIDRQARIMECSYAQALGAVLSELVRRYPNGVRIPS